jgi:hypothetical protein
MKSRPKSQKLFPSSLYLPGLGFGGVDLGGITVIWARDEFAAASAQRVGMQAKPPRRIAIFSFVNFWEGGVV